MKKFLLLTLVSMLSAIGAWAEDVTYEISNTYGTGTVVISTIEDGEKTIVTATVTVTSSDQGHVFNEWCKANSDALTGVDSVSFTSGSVLASVDINELSTYAPSCTAINASNCEFRSSSAIEITNTVVKNLWLDGICNYDADNTDNWSYTYKPFTITGCTALETLSMKNASITDGVNDPATLKIASNTALKTLNMSGTTFAATIRGGWASATIDFSGNTSLETLICPTTISSYGTKTLNISNDSKLVGIVVPKGLTESNVTKDGCDLEYIITCTTNTNNVTTVTMDVLKDMGTNTATNVQTAYSQAKYGTVDIAKVVTSNNVTVSNSDIAALSILNCESFDFSEATMDEGETFSFINTNCHYILMPCGITDVNADMFRVVNEDGTIKEECTKLYSAVSFDNNSSATSASAYVKKKGELYGATALYGGEKKTLTSLQISGTLNAADLSVGGGYQHVNSAGNYDATATESNCIANTKTAFGGYYATITTLDLTYATFDDNSDMRIAKLVGDGIVNMYFPISNTVTEIPEGCLQGNFNNMVSVCIPGNIKKIGSYAFYMNGKPLVDVYTTKTDDNGNGFTSRTDDANYSADNIIDYWSEENQKVTDANGKQINGCVTLSENITEIESYAFVSNNFRDVYVMATTAPKCAYNAFGSVTYCKNNSGPSATIDAVNQDDYYDTTNGWMGYLHFPENATDPQNYTDLTRKYSIPDEDGKTDGDGNPVFWPNQLEWERSFAQACAGITWEYWKDADDGDAYKGVYGNDGFSGVGSYKEWASSTEWTGDKVLKTYYGTGAKYNDWVDTEKASTAVYNTEYMGWHQFVLAYTKNFKTEDPQFNVTRITNNDWYTICLPFDLTKAQLEAAFGEGVKLCTLYGVKRDDTKDQEQITLMFTKDLVANNKYWNFKDSEYTIKNCADHYMDAGENGAILQSGMPYLICPNLPQTTLDAIANKSLTKFTISYKEGDYEFKKYPYTAYKVNATNQNDETCYVEDEDGVKTNYTYSFVGRYDNEGTVPQYAYFMSWKIKDKETGEHTKHKWYRNASGKAYTWTPYVALIGAQWKVQVVNNKLSFTGQETGYIDNYTVSYEAGSENDDFASWIKTGEAKIEFAIDGEDESSEVTGITEVTTSAQTQQSDAIYSINGQRVNGALNKGIYVKNGKKFVVK